MTGNIREFPNRRAAPPWHTALYRSRKGVLKSNLANVVMAFTECPELQGCVRLDTFSNRIMLVEPPPWLSMSEANDFRPREWRNIDDLNATVWLQGQNIQVGDALVGKGVEAVAHRDSFHPVRAYLLSLEWDGTERLHDLLPVYFGSKRTDYTEQAGIKWMMQAVRRVVSPGIQADATLVLEGAQGIRKSTALRTLAGSWFTDQISDFSSKDSGIDLQGVWVVELSELDAVRKVETSKVKQFLTRRYDRFRPPYGRRTEEFPRQCVFAATTNELEWMRDTTGNRRFWPVTCGEIDIDGLERDRDQLWAEAVYKAVVQGIPHWFSTDLLNSLARNEQEARMDEDSWTDYVRPYLRDKSFVTVSNVLSMCFGREAGDHAKADQVRVKEILKSLGWVPFRPRSGDDRQRGYRPGPGISGPQNGPDSAGPGRGGPGSDPGPADCGPGSETSENPMESMAVHVVQGGPGSFETENGIGESGNKSSENAGPMRDSLDHPELASDPKLLARSTHPGPTLDHPDGSRVDQPKIDRFDALKGPGLDAEDLPENDPC